MKTLRELLSEKKLSIVRRWVGETLNMYSPDAAGFFKRESNPFDNPVGAAVRRGCQGIFDNLLVGMDPQVICSHLREIIKIRAIQDFSPSRAVSFVFLLKPSIRLELRSSGFDKEPDPDLIELEKQIDQIALFAFDIYSQCRDQVFELRVNEVKRSISGILREFTSDCSESESLANRADEKASSQGGGH
jgi:hypothetical protein